MLEPLQGGVKHERRGEGTRDTGNSMSKGMGVKPDAFLMRLLWAPPWGRYSEGYPRRPTPARGRNGTRETPVNDKEGTK